MECVWLLALLRMQIVQMYIVLQYSSTVVRILALCCHLHTLFEYFKYKQITFSPYLRGRGVSNCVFSHFVYVFSFRIVSVIVRIESLKN